MQVENEHVAPVTHHVDRRLDLEKRRRVTDMSSDEMRRLLLTSEVTGLPNRRAFEEAGPAPATAVSDLDGLKALNKHGYAVGDAILRAKADALREAGLEAYHDKGDEFLFRAADVAELQGRLECARTLLRSRSIEVEGADGATLQVRGADFTYGAGTGLVQAELLLRTRKAEREARGELARGHLCGISVSTVTKLRAEVLHRDSPSVTVTSVTVQPC
jgi:GGDEF domain-containing protein